MFALKPFTTLPSRANSKAATFPFESMAEGQAFFVANKDEKDDAAKRMAPICATAGKRLGKKFAVRTIIEEGVKGAGVYCVKA